MNTQPGPCVLVREVIEWMNAMSSTCCDKCGSSDESNLPLRPVRTKGHGLFIRLPFLPWKLRKFSAPGNGSPLRFSSSGLCSQRSMCEAAPGQKRCNTCLAFGAKCGRAGDAAVEGLAARRSNPPSKRDNATPVIAVVALPKNERRDIGRSAEHCSAGAAELPNAERCSALLIADFIGG